MPAARPSQMAVLAVLVGATAAGPMCMNIFVPSMPGLQQALSASYGAVQLTLSLYLVTFALAQLLYGPVSDRFGRRPTLVVGLSVFVGGSLLCTVAPSIEMLIAGRCIQALGACAGMVLARAIVRDLYDRDQAASMIAYITMAMMVAPMVAPAVGGFLDGWFGWRSSFAFVVVVGAVILVSVVRLLGETRPAAGGEFRLASMFWSFAGLLRKPLFLGYAFMVAFTAVSFFSFLSGAPYIMIKLLGRPPSEYGLYYTGVAALYMAANFISGRTSRRWGIDRLIVVGLFISLISGIGGATLYALGMLSPLLLFGTMGMISFGHGFCLANGLAGAVSVCPERAGSASGLAGFVQMGLGATASYVAGLFMDQDATPVFVGMLLGSILSMASFFGPRLRRG